MTLTNIEKAARLVFTDKFGHSIVNAGWNPYANKANLMELECALSEKYSVEIRISHAGIYVEIETFKNTTDHLAKTYLPFNKKLSSKEIFTARANAVMDVVSQIYDKGRE